MKPYRNPCMEKIITTRSCDTGHDSSHLSNRGSGPSESGNLLSPIFTVRSLHMVHVIPVSSHHVPFLWDSTVTSPQDLSSCQSYSTLLLLTVPVITLVVHVSVSPTFLLRRLTDESTHPLLRLTHPTSV